MMENMIYTTTDEKTYIFNVRDISMIHEAAEEGKIEIIFGSGYRAKVPGNMQDFVKSYSHWSGTERCYEGQRPEVRMSPTWD